MSVHKYTQRRVIAFFSIFIFRPQLNDLFVKYLIDYGQPREKKPKKITHDNWTLLLNNATLCTAHQYRNENEKSFMKLLCHWHVQSRSLICSFGIRLYSLFFLPVSSLKLYRNYYFSFTFSYSFFSLSLFCWLLLMFQFSLHFYVVILL